MRAFTYVGIHRPTPLDTVLFLATSTSPTRDLVRARALRAYMRALAHPRYLDRPVPRWAKRAGTCIVYYRLPGDDLGAFDVHAVEHFADWVSYRARYEFSLRLARKAQASARTLYALGLEAKDTATAFLRFGEALGAAIADPEVRVDVIATLWAEEIAEAQQFLARNKLDI